MSRRRRFTALIGTATVLLTAAGVRLAAAQTVTLNVPLTVADSISPAPPLLVSTTGLPPDVGPVTIQVEVARDQSFQSPLFVDSRQAEEFTFTLRQLLPERAVAWFRASLLDQHGTVLARSTSSHPVRSWIRLVGPGLRPNDVQFTRQPRFTWSAASLTLPPGLWSFDLTVLITATNEPAFSVTNLSDTTFVFPQLLEAKTSYKWRLRARALNSAASDDITVVSPSTFTIASADQPPITLFYQNFPNPFPTARSAVTCFWFDLAQRAEVHLTIYDIRLREVKNIVPGPLGSNLPAGAYGRQGDPTQGGCDSRLAWDGTDDRGHVVPRGVYIARFEAGGVAQVAKILFLGR